MKTRHAKILMGSVMVARGTSFIFSKNLMHSMSPLSVLAVRFLLAFIILSFIFNKKMRECNKDSIKGGLILGVLYTVCMILEMYGLRNIDTGVASFIENMAIVIVPIYVAVYTRKLPRSITMLCALVAVAGVGCLSITQNVQGTFNFGIVLAILAALDYGFCILATQKVSQKGDPVTIGIIQLGSMGLFSLLIALPMGEFSMPKSGNEWLMILMLVLICSCFGFTFQPVAQKYIKAETAAMFAVLNPLSTSVIGILIVGEAHGILTLVGYALILLSMIIYNIDEAKNA